MTGMVGGSSVSELPANPQPCKGLEFRLGLETLPAENKTNCVPNLVLK